MDAKDVVLHQHDAVWCRGDLSVVDELFAEDFVGRHPGAPDWNGRRALKDVVTAVRTGFPDFKEVVEEVISETGHHLLPCDGVGYAPRAIHGLGANG
jgi:ketosteroid isomerase-like protein